jgi:hypothetical protein
MIDRERMTEEGSKLDMKEERGGQHHYHQNHTMIFCQSLMIFIQKHLKIT